MEGFINRRNDVIPRLFLRSFVESTQGDDINDEKLRNTGTTKFVKRNVAELLLERCWKGGGFGNSL